MNQSIFKKSHYKDRQKILTQELENRTFGLISKSNLKALVKNIDLDCQYKFLTFNLQDSKILLERLKKHSIEFKYNIQILYEGDKLSSFYFDDSTHYDFSDNFKTPLVAIATIKKKSISKNYIVILL